MFCIQRILMPNFTFGASEAKYQRGRLAAYADSKTVIAQSGYLSFCTYYNALSTVVWREQCDLQTLIFRASGTGKTTVRLLVVTENNVVYELARSTLVLAAAEQTVFEYNLKNMTYRGIVYVEIIAAEESVTFTGGGWYTTDVPKRDVVLGISITHFNRKQYVLPSIARVKKEILDDADYQGKILFTVVDNSQNITADEAPGVDVIPNANTGGSGGFMRGLLHYQNDTKATHVLFMDDDASCETESIKRAYWILRYAMKDNSAVAGSLFLDDRPDVLIEKGARFDYMCRPAFNGWNMKIKQQVVKAETVSKPINYGAWWFFAFPIAAMKYYAFPFFVRGDDIQFSLNNQFNIIAPIGITCYGENFAYKVNPMTSYFDTRSHLINTLLFQRKASKVLKTYKKYYLSCLKSHRYDSIDAIRLALKHVFSPLDFWESNYDMVKIRPLINQITSTEKLQEVNLTQLNLVYSSKKRDGLLNKLKLKLTCNGLLLPLKDKIIFQTLSFNANYAAIFRYKNILYFNPLSRQGYVIHVSRTAFFKRLFLLWLDLYRIRRQFSQQQKKYRDNIGVLTSKAFWERALLNQKVTED